MRQAATCAKGVLVLVQELGAAVSDRPSIMLHNEVICGLLGVILEPPIAVQVLLELGAERAVCCLSAVRSHQSVAKTGTLLDRCQFNKHSQPSCHETELATYVMLFTCTVTYALHGAGPRRLCLGHAHTATRPTADLG